MPIDVAGLDVAIADTCNRIKEMEAELRAMPEYNEQRKRYGARTKIGSREQLADIFYNVMGYPGGKINPETGKLSLDDEALREINTPYTQLFQQAQKLHKLRSTYLQGFKSEICNGRIHTFFNLHKVVTYRGSSDSPNLQNIPIRDPLIGKVIRSVIKPHDPNNVIVEIDYSTLEVVIGACLHRDPSMMEYLMTGFDFHRATAQDCFFLGDNVPKPLRQMAKVTNFSLIYGDYFAAIATKLWKSCESERIEGVPVHEYLKTKNIRGLGSEHNLSPDTFMAHMKGVCDRFWSQRFPVFAKWRNDTWDTYLRNGCLYTKTGFRIHGVFKRNEILNTETQGCAFHCLLRSVIEITKEISRRGMRSRLFCQIHDSILAEVPRTEVDDYIEMANAIMTYKLAAAWPWVILPLKTEAEVGENWADKKPYHKK